MKRTARNLRVFEICRSHCRAVEYFFTGALASVRLLASAIFVLGIVSTASAAPIYSEFSSISTIDSITDTGFSSQGTSINPLSSSASMSGGQMTLSTIGSAIWSSASSLTVELDAVKTDTDINGTNLASGGVSVFSYTFTVPTDTTVTVDYDVVSTSTWDGGALNGIPGSNFLRWWVMQSLIEVVGVGDLSLSYTGFNVPAIFSPFVHNGSIVFNILAGTNTVKIRTGFNSSSGSTSADDRAIDGEYQITIGPIPEPTTLVLATIGLLGLSCRRRKQA